MFSNKLIIFLIICGLLTSSFQEIDPARDSHIGYNSNNIPMGIANSECDDGRTSIENDWDGNSVNYTCMSTNPYPVMINIPATEECDEIPHNYHPFHFCMKDKISYNHILPTYGDHRPLWAKFGEYVFLPIQRWQHNIEHGTIVMVYHPCANQHEVDKLRKLVTGCLRKHIITAYNLLPKEYPMALVSWGCRLWINVVVPEIVKSFIKRKALRGPEGSVERDGQYDHFIKKPASVPRGSNIFDKKLCPPESVPQIIPMY